MGHTHVWKSGGHVAGVRSKLWTRDEVLKALALYHVLPFGKNDKANAEVVALARALGRTPSSVSLKLSNFASLDPYHRERGVRGMPNASTLDREVWEEFHVRWQDLADALLSTQSAAESPSGPRMPSGPTTQEQVVRARRGQYFFRRAVLAAYDRECCITGISEPSLLRASHIVPWSESEPSRLDPRNGLCLNALHDAAFDQNLLTLDEGLRVRLSPLLAESVPSDVFSEMFGRYEGRQIREPKRFPPAVAYLDVHRRRFRGA